MKRTLKSLLLLDLRKKMRLSQTRFARAMGYGLSSVARWETSTEPTGDALLRIAGVADSAGLYALGHGFRLLYLDDVKEQYPWPDLIVGMGRKKTDPTPAFLFVRLKGKKEIDLAMEFQNNLEVLREKQ